MAGTQDTADTNSNFCSLWRRAIPGLAGGLEGAGQQGVSDRNLNPPAYYPSCHVTGPNGYFFLERIMPFVLPL